MRADDIPDIFISSQIIDENLAKERLVDLANYDFIDGLYISLLDQMSIDGSIYALPVNNVMYGIYYNKTLMEEHGWELQNRSSGQGAGRNRVRCGGDGETYPYVLVTRGDAPLEDGQTYRIAFTANSYTEEVGQTYNVQVEEGTLSTFVCTWLEEQGTVSPDGNPWE